MSFAQRYIDKNIRVEKFIQDQPSEELGIIVIIPVLNEPDLINTLDSLKGCQQPECKVEVIVVVNESEISSISVREQNNLTLHEIDHWLSGNSNPGFRLYVIQPEPFPKKHAGAGLARKTGMDEAIYRFHRVNKPGGILVSLDADTLVRQNYFVEIEKFFKTEEIIGATIQFFHRADEIKDKLQKEGILLYEKYMHYYKKAMEYTGFPHAIYTVGSAFAVRADAYVKQGGMSKRQAGEDFYFLHKLTQAGKVVELNSTCVYPSARISDRVPFGTGPVLKKWMQGDRSLSQTYNMQAFKDLKRFFKLLPVFYELNTAPFNEENLGKAMYVFLLKDKYMEKLTEVKKNSSTFKNFEKRFFQYFNAFKLLKFLNFSHLEFYSYQGLMDAELQLEKLILNEE